MSMQRLLGALLLASCATATSPPAAIGPRIGTRHAQETAAIKAPRSSETAPRPVPPPQAQYLLVATGELDAANAELDDGHVVRALYALADALEVVAPQRADEIVSLRERTQALGRAELEPDAHAGLAQLALDVATHVLAGAHPWADRDRQRLVNAVDAMASATVRIDPHRRLGDQAGALRSVFDASVRAVYAATGAAEPETTPTEGSALSEPLTDGLAASQ
jgi:hypothetical protein